MFESRVGELAALGTAFCWTITAMSFQSAGRRVGSLSVNLIRLLIGFAFLSLWTGVMRGRAFPTDFPASAWLWLSMSGIVGFALGDLFLFRAFVVVGARISVLVMSAAPPLTALIGWAVLGEVLTRLELIGMTLTVGGIALVVFERPAGERGNGDSGSAVSGRAWTGVLLAFGGAAGQALGLVLGKMGMGALDPFAATQVRVLAGIVGFAAIFTVARRWGRIGVALRHGAAMRRITIGSFFGPFLGVSLSLLAVQRTSTGVASTIMAIVPVLIIPPAVFLFRERVTFREVVGALVAVGGVAVMFI